MANARSQNAYLYCYNDAVNLFDADGAKPEVVRNNITVDPGGSSVSKKQNNAPKTSSKSIPSAKEFSAAIAKGFSDPLWVQATGGGTTAKKTQGEAVVVSGRKQSSNFAYNFVESGIRGIKNYQAEGITDITWIVFSEPDWSEDEANKNKANFQKTAKSLDVKLVLVANNQQFINYLNTGNKNKKEGEREKKITNMTIYGHGHPGDMDLGEEKITKTQLEQLNGAVFDNTKTVLYTCRGANDEKDITAIAQIFSNITQGETKAMYGRVDYAYIAFPIEKKHRKELIKVHAFESVLNILKFDALSKAAGSLEMSLTIAEAYDYLQFSKEINKEIEALRKETGYIQEGAFYDPIPGKQAGNAPEVLRPSSYWMTFQPIND